MVKTKHFFRRILCPVSKVVMLDYDTFAETERVWVHETALSKQCELKIQSGRIG